MRFNLTKITVINTREYYGNEYSAIKILWMGECQIEDLHSFITSNF